MTDSSDGDADPNEERLHDLIAEYNRRLDQGEAIEPARFASEHPEVQGELSRHFENIATLESLAGPTASRAQSDPSATVISGQTHDGGHAETMIEGSRSGDAARISKDAPRTQFGRYRIVKELGRGAMGAVYLAHDEQLDREVALKIPKFETDMNDELLERFYREARAAATLQNSGICPVFDVGELDGQHYITMAYIKGRPLRDFTKSSKRQGCKQVARVIRKVALAMAEAHEHDVTHRDLKPANIMINQKNEPVVMDFGLARRSTEGEERLTHTGTVIGTPAYMSPEQVDGDNDNVGPHADIYSLGVIFYEMLTGRLPFQGNLMSILKQIATDDPTPPAEVRSDIDATLQTICLNMMAKKIEDRPASMSDVARDLTGWLQGRQVVADESEPLETSRVPRQQASGNDEPTAPLGQPAMPIINVEPEATSVRTPKQGDRGVPPKNRKILIAAGLGGVAVLLAGIMFIVQFGKVKVQITVDDPSLALKVDGDEVVIEGEGVPIRLSAGTHELIVKQGGLEFEAKEFRVRKNGRNAIHVVVVGEEVQLLMDGKRPPTRGDRGTQVDEHTIRREPAHPDNTPGHPNDWIDLFNGRDLAGWSRRGNADWTVENGAIFAGTGADGQLVSDQTVRDFELTLEVFFEAQGNGGIWFHLPPEIRVAEKGYEVQVAGSRGDPNGNYTGGIFEAARPVARVSPPVARDGEWVSIRLLVDGTRIRSWVDDRMTADYKGAARRMGGGFLAFPTHSLSNGRVGYRNIRLRRISTENMTGP